MKVLKFFVCLLLINNSYSQIFKVLDVPEVFQEQTQWCWAGVSKSILDYYCYPFEQCEIADYARQVIDWHDFGSTDCCVNPNLGCNYWNYMFGAPGSLLDILAYFGSIQSYPVGDYLPREEAGAELLAGRPFVIRWGWSSGGGHFLVGHGIDDDGTGQVSSQVSLHYMDPWFGEGFHISIYDWVIFGGNHMWTHTIVLTTNPPSIPFTIIATAGDNGTINPIGNVTVEQEADQTFTFIPDINYHIDSVFVDGIYNAAAVANECYIFENVTANHTIHVTFADETSIKQYNTETAILVYPNPANDKIIIECGQLYISIILYDISGKEVLSRNANGKTEINISHLPKGIYNVSAFSEGKIIGSSKIVKQ